MVVLVSFGFLQEKAPPVTFTLSPHIVERPLGPFCKVSPDKASSEVVLFKNIVQFGSGPPVPFPLKTFSGKHLLST